VTVSLLPAGFVVSRPHETATHSVEWHKEISWNSAPAFERYLMEMLKLGEVAWRRYYSLNQ